MRSGSEQQSMLPFAYTFDNGSAVTPVETSRGNIFPACDGPSGCNCHVAAPYCNDYNPSSGCSFFSDTNMPSYIGGYFGPLVVFWIMMRYVRVLRRRHAQQSEAEHARAVRAAEENAQPPPEPPQPPISIAKQYLGAQGLASDDKWLRVKIALTFGGILMDIGVNNVAYGIFMHLSLLENLTPPERNIMGTSDAALVPLEVVFGGIERFMLTVAYRSLISGNKRQAGRVFYLGVGLALFFGILVASIGSLLSLSPLVFEALTYPSLAVDRALYPNCSQIPTPAVLSGPIRTYYMLRLWKMPFRYLSGALGSYMNGGGMIFLFGYVNAIEAAVPLVIWFTGVSSGWFGNNLVLYGVANFVGSVSCALISLTIILASPALRQRAGIEAPWRHFSRRAPEAGKSDDQGASLAGYAAAVSGEAVADTSVSFLASQAAQNVITALALELPNTVVQYVTAQRGLPVQYQINALQSSIAISGRSWTAGVEQFLRMLGSNRLARKEYKSFRVLVSVYLWYVLAVGIVAGPLSILPFYRAVAYDRTQSACYFLESYDCAPAFYEIFSGSESISGAFLAFAFLAPFNCLNGYLQTVLDTCLDYGFTCRAAVASFICAFVPALLIASLAFENSPVAFALAWYSPHFLILPLYAWRLRSNFCAMDDGARGPWDLAASTDITVPRVDVELRGSVSTASVRVRPNAAPSAADWLEAAAADAGIGASAKSIKSQDKEAAQVEMPGSGGMPSVPMAAAPADETTPGARGSRHRD